MQDTNKNWQGESNQDKSISELKERVHVLPINVIESEHGEKTVSQLHHLPTLQLFLSGQASGK